MRLINRSDVQDEKIREIFEFCSGELGINAMKIVVEKRSTIMRGYDGYSFNGKKEIHIIIKDDKFDKQTYPYFRDYSKRRLNYTKDNYRYSEELKKWVPKPGYVEVLRDTGYLPHLILSKEEKLVSIMAHELRHQWQKKRRPRSEWAYGSNNGKHTRVGVEIDASAYDIRKTREWRRMHAVDIYREQPDTNHML